MAEVLTVRINSANSMYVRRQAEQSGLSVSATIETLIDEARRRGWTLEARRGAVVEDGAHD